MDKVYALLKEWWEESGPPTKGDDENVFRPHSS